MNEMVFVALLIIISKNVFFYFLTDVRSISRTYDCLPFETSAALNHHIDELLIAILKQIRHKLNPDLHPSPDDYTEPEMRRRDKQGPVGFLGKLYRRLSRKGRPKKK